MFIVESPPPNENEMKEFSVANPMSIPFSDSVMTPFDDSAYTLLDDDEQKKVPGRFQQKHGAILLAVGAVVAVVATPIAMMSGSGSSSSATSDPIVCAGTQRITPTFVKSNCNVIVGDLEVANDFQGEKSV